MVPSIQFVPKGLGQSLYLSDEAANCTFTSLQHLGNCKITYIIPLLRSSSKVVGDEIDKEFLMP